MEVTNASKPENHAHEDSFDPKIIYLIVMPIILIFGSTGNLMSFVLMSRKAMRKLSICVYLRCLAVFDTVSLWANAVLVLLYYGTDSEIVHGFYLGCVSYRMTLLFHQVGAWTVLAVTVERFIALYIPYKAERLCTVRSAKIVCSVLIIIATLLNLPHFFLQGTVNHDHEGHKTCNFTEVGEIFAVGPYSTFMILIWCFVPAIIMIIFSCLMAVKLYERLNKSTVQSRSAKSVTNTVVILLTVSLTFAVLTLPFGVDFLVHHDPFTYDAHKVVPNILLFLNQAVNFFLYCCTSKMFRNELRKMFGLAPNAVMSTTSGTPRDTQTKSGDHTNRTNLITTSTQQSGSKKDKSEDNKDQFEDKKGTTSAAEVENLTAIQQSDDECKPKVKTSHTEVKNLRTSQQPEDKLESEDRIVE